MHAGLTLIHTHETILGHSFFNYILVEVSSIFNLKDIECIPGSTI